MRYSAPTLSGWARRLWPAAAYQFAFVAAISLLKVAANAAVLARFNAGALPFLYIGAAAVTAVLAALSATRQESIGRPSGLGVFGAIVASSVTGLLITGSGPAALLLYLFAEIFATHAAITFWA